MFTKIKLHDFQCHVDLELELDKITTLVGPSDSGKTAVLRAIDWVCFNRGRTALLVRRGCSDASVTVEVDGHTVVRSTDGNSYTLDGRLFSAIGKTIPVEVVDTFRMTDDNVQRQHDYLFWFTQSGSGLVSNLNKIVDLSKLETWVHNGIAKDRKFKEQETYLTTRLEELKREKASLSCYRDMDVELAVLEATYQLLCADRERLSGLEQVLGEYSETLTAVHACRRFVDDLKSVLASYDVLVAGYKKCQDLESLVSSVDNLEVGIAYRRDFCASLTGLDDLVADLRRLDDLTVILDSYDSCECSIKETTEFSEDLRGLLSDYGVLSVMQKRCTELDKAVSALPEVPDRTELVSLMAELDGIIKTASQVKSMENDLAVYDATVADVVKAEDSLVALRAEFNERMEGRCPVCGQTWEECKDVVSK